MDVNQMLFYESLRITVGPWLKLRLGLKIDGQNNVPDNGAAIIISNHRSSMDPLLLAYSIPNRYINFGAASWSWKIPVFGQLHQWLGAFPLHLTGGEGIEKQLTKGKELLENGEVVGLFPEGGQTILEPGKVEKIRRFKTGFARLALQTRVPVIPCAVVGSGERQLMKLPGPLVERLTKIPQKKDFTSVIYKKAKVRIGRPIDMGDLYDRPIDKQLLDLITSKMRSIVIRLYNGEELDRFLTGETPFDFAYERVGGVTKKLL